MARAFRQAFTRMSRKLVTNDLFPFTGSNSLREARYIEQLLEVL